MNRCLSAMFVTSTASTAIALSVGCSSTSTPISEAGKGFSQYMEVKRELAAEISHGLLQAESDQYKLVAITGPAYPVGAILDADNPADILTRDCLVPSTALPQPEKWASLPTWTSTKTIGLTVGLPPPIVSTLGDANIDINNSNGGIFSMNDISQQLVARNDFIQALQRESCQKSIGSNDVLVIRGVVSGREILKSKRALKADAGLKIANKGNYSFKYDNTGGFELTDATVVPKFVIITLLKGSTRGPSIVESLVAPSDNILKKLETIGFHSNP